MKKSLFVSLFAVILLVQVPSSLLGQSGPNIAMDKARTHLERTDLIIEHAKEVVRTSNSPVAQFNLQSSITSQEEAWECFRHRSTKMARNLTFRAREKAQDAITAGRQTEQNEIVVQNKLDQLKEMLLRVQEIVSASTGISFEATYISAQNNLRLVREFYHSRQYRAALTLANQIEKSLQQIIHAQNQDNQDRHRANYELRTEAVRELIDRAEADLADCDSEAASRLLIQARETYAAACELGLQTRYQAALRVLQSTKQITDEFVDICRGQQRLQSRYDRLWSRAARLKEVVSPSDDYAMKLLELAYEQLELAEDWLQVGKGEAATAALKASELALAQLKRYLRKSGF